MTKYFKKDEGIKARLVRGAYLQRSDETFDEYTSSVSIFLKSLSQDDYERFLSIKAEVKDVLSGKLMTKNSEENFDKI